MGQPQVVSIGECGLDYNRDFSPRDVQCRWLGEQIQLAGELHMPLFLHERDAHEDFVAMLREHQGVVDKAVVHCFTGTAQELHTYIVCILVLQAGSVTNGAASICVNWSGIFLWIV